MIATETQPTDAPSRAIGYSFDPVPSILKVERRQGHLTDFDLVLASEMVAIARWGGRDDSCWLVKATLAQRLGVTTRTIQNAWRRLKARGWLIERAVGTVDPLDHRNHTGRRFHFGWVATPEAAGPSGEKAPSPLPEKPASPNDRGILSPEKTTDAVVVLDLGWDSEEPRDEGAIKDGTDGGMSTINRGSPSVAGLPRVRASHEPDQPPISSQKVSPLPAPLADALASPAIGEPLRRQIGRMIPRWLASHPAERVAAALRAMIEAARHRRVKSPIGYLVGTLRNMGVENEKPSELVPPSLPRRTPDAERTAERLAEIRRGECDAAERERRWAALPDAERRAIEAAVEAGNPRPPGLPDRLWMLTRRAACLERMGAAASEGERLSSHQGSM